MSKTSIDKTRIGGSKVRTGCITCKSRHVKCDETKPVCNRCVRADRACGGYSPTPKSEPLPVGHKFVHYVDKSEVIRLSRSPSPFVDFDAVSLRAWDFFLNSTAVQLQRPFPARIWSEYLTRLALSNGAIKHGIVALASLHENLMSADPDTTSARQVLALEHYGKSIRDVVYANRRDQQSAVLTTLTSSLLFCAIESVQGHMLSAMKHISAGLSLLAEHRDTIFLVGSEEDREFPGFTFALQEIFFNLAGQSLSYEDRLILNNPKLVNYLNSARNEIESPAMSIGRAAQDLTRLFNDVLLFATWSESRRTDTDYPGQDLLDAVDSLQVRYEAWIQIYHELLAASPRRLSSDTSERQALLELRVNQLLCRIALKISFDDTQTAFDRCRTEFEAVVQACEDLMVLESQDNVETGGSQSCPKMPQITFRMSLGVIPGLLFTCTKCRDQVVRYRALEILKRIKRRESIWDSDTVSIVGERFVKIEEQNARAYWEQQGYPQDQEPGLPAEVQPSSPSTTRLRIPESARIHSMIVDLPEDNDVSRASIAFLRTGDPGNRHVEYMQWENSWM